MVNYWKSRNRAMTVARNYEVSIGHAKGAPLFVRTMATPTIKRYEQNGIISSIDNNAPRRRVLKNGTRRVVYK